MNEFEEHRAHLRSVAYRMLGSLPEAEDAVQEAWLRMDRADVSDVRNMRRLADDGGRAHLPGYAARPQRPARAAARRDRDPGPHIATAEAVDPEQEALLADSIGAALLVILQRLSPAERLAFVLHDMFDLPFAEIAPIVGRSENTAAQLAARAPPSRARQNPGPGNGSRAPAAARGRVSGRGARRRLRLAAGRTRQRCGAAGRCRRRGQRTSRSAARRRSPPTRAASRPTPVSPSPRWWTARSGSSSHPRGRLALVLRFAVVGDKITEIDIEADPESAAANSVWPSWTDLRS